MLQPPAHPPVKLCNNNEKKFDSSNIKQLFRLSRLFPFLFYSCWREERLVRIFDVKLKSLASTSKNFSLPQNQAKDGVVYLDERRIRYGKSWSLFKVSTSKENCVLRTFNKQHDIFEGLSYVEGCLFSLLHRKIVTTFAKN